MAFHLKRAVMAAGFGLLVLIAILYWAAKPAWLNEPFLHYASEQWRTMRSGNLLERESRKIVGTAALDCGRVPLNGSATKLNTCIFREWAAKRAFKASWDLLGIDAVVEDGLLGTADGRLYHFQYLEGPNVPDYRLVNIRECPKPVTLRADSTTGLFYCD
jgi:hypothetical protein